MWRRSIVVTDYLISVTDWQATLDDYKPGDPIGLGPTEADAVYALYEQMEEREALHDREIEEREALHRENTMGKVLGFDRRGS